MEIFQLFNFNGKDCKIWEIYEAYKKLCNSRGIFMSLLPSKTDPRNGKNWKYFEAVYERYDKSTVFDPYVFMKAQFRNVPKDKIVFPAQLKTNLADTKYKDYRDSLKLKEANPTTNSEKIMLNLANTFTLFRGWWKKEGKNEHDYSFLFKIKDGELISIGMSLCMQGMVSKYFMAVSKHFNREYSNLDPDMQYEVAEPDELKNFRVRLRLDEDAYDFAKEIFKGEIM